MKVEIFFEHLSSRTLEDNKCANNCSAASSKHIFSLLIVKGLAFLIGFRARRSIGWLPTQRSSKGCRNL